MTRLWNLQPHHRAHQASTKVREKVFDLLQRTMIPTLCVMVNVSSVATIAFVCSHSINTASANAICITGSAYEQRNKMEKELVTGSLWELYC